MPPDGPEPSGLDDALFGADTAPNPIVRPPGATERGDALDDALFGTDVSAAGPTGVRADDDAEVDAALFGTEAAPRPGPRANDDAWVDAAAGAGPAADTSLFDDAPGGVGAGATVRRAPIEGSRRGSRVAVAVVAALLVLGLGGVAYAVLATRDDGQGKPKVKVQGVSATASSRPADPSTSSTTSTTAATTTTVAPTTTTAPPTTTPAPVATTPEAPVVTEPPVEIPPPVDTDPTTTTTTTAPPTTTTTTTP